ncbi:MAG: SRPBCC family protein [Gemmatimonas sp.]
MAIRKDGTGKRWVEMDVVLPATPEQVWHAVATGNGNAAWFTAGEIEPRVGGAFMLDFGGGNMTRGEVTRWNPPHEFGYVERGWMGDAPDVYTDIVISPRANGSSLVRMTHTITTPSDEWDDVVESFEKGWPGFFEVLHIYLQHHAGNEAGVFMTVAHTAEDSLAVWARLCDALNLTGANVGERRTIASGPEMYSGTVEYTRQDATQRYVTLRVNAPFPGVLFAGTSPATRPGAKTNVTVCRYSYGVDAATRTADLRTAWEQWMHTSFKEAETAAAE